MEPALQNDVILQQVTQSTKIKAMESQFII